MIALASGLEWRCWSEQLTPDQLQLALEELEQTIAANQAGQDAVAAAVGLPRQPRPTRRVATTGRSGSPAAIRPAGRLARFRGVLQVDGYSGFKAWPARAPTPR